MVKRLDEKAELQRAQKCKQAARDCIARGWKPLAVRRGNKGPDSEGWPQWPVGDADAYMKEHFANIPLANVAIQMGALSGGLTDVDLDCREAVYLAPHFLPDTGAVFGRQSKPRSHWLYITNLHETEQRAAIQFKESRALTAEEVMLVELRVGGDGKGACTLAPPSVHPSGEDITWDEDGNPAEVDGAELKRCGALLAAATLLVRHYPPSGARHAAALVLGGFLARAGRDEEQIAEFVEVVANAANDEEVDDRVAAAKSAVKRLANGEDTPGLPRMREEWGQAVADLFAEWIGYDTHSAQRNVSLDERIVERIAELARLSKVDYDRARVQVAKELGIRKATLDEEVAKQRTEQAQRAEAPPPPDIGMLAALSAEIIASEDVLGLFGGDFGAVYANERRNAQLLYLVCTSRLFNVKETMHAAVKGTSAIGKSHLLSPRPNTPIPTKSFLPAGPAAPTNRAPNRPLKSSHLRLS